MPTVAEFMSTRDSRSITIWVPFMEGSASLPPLIGHVYRTLPLWVTVIWWVERFTVEMRLSPIMNDVVRVPTPQFPPPTSQSARSPETETPSPTGQ